MKRKKQTTNNKSQEVSSESSLVNARGSAIRIEVINALLLYEEEYNPATTVVAALSQQGKQESKIVEILFLSARLATLSE